MYPAQPDYLAPQEIICYHRAKYPKIFGIPLRNYSPTAFRILGTPYRLCIRVILCNVVLYASFLHHRA